MREQIYILENLKSFEPTHIFECGQCFRWNLEKDNSYTGVIGKSVLNIKKEQHNIIIKGISKDNIKDVCELYFDLSTNYEQIKEQLSLIDNNVKLSVEYGKGIRILKQDFWETLISFIISANNNIPRIKGIIERLSQQYGQPLIWSNKTYYAFPTPEELSKATIEDLRKIGLGFRDKRVFETTYKYIKEKEEINEIIKSKNALQIREKLLEFPGVGPKVADCIMLFGLKKYEVFPIDVWVRRVITELYSEELLKSTKSITPKNILEFASQKFGKNAGLAQQYLFYWRRNQKGTVQFLSP